MNSQFDDQWKQLKHVSPTQREKDELRERIWHTIKSPSVNRSPKRNYQWKALLASCLFFLICGGVIWKVISDGTKPYTAERRNAGEQQAAMDNAFSWGLKNVSIEKSQKGWEINSTKTSSKVGNIEIITEGEMKGIVASLPIYVKEDLENFPYPTSMNIEHVKMVDTAIRYHFFIPIEKEKIAHFSFDYPKLEHAEIFQAMATLKIAGLAPAEHQEQLYVRHGYGTMPFPVGLEPISISTSKEIYHWKEASFSAYQQYLDKIPGGLSNWRMEKAKGGTSATFVSDDGKQIVTINLDEQTLIYEFTYLHDDE